MRLSGIWLPASYCVLRVFFFRESLFPSFSLTFHLSSPHVWKDILHICTRMKGQCSLYAHIRYFELDRKCAISSVSPTPLKIPDVRRNEIVNSNNGCCFRLRADTLSTFIVSGISFCLVSHWKCNYVPTSFLFDIRLEINLSFKEIKKKKTNYSVNYFL